MFLGQAIYVLGPLHLEVIWLLRGLTPDFKTIANFRKDNRGAFKLVFRQVVLLCRKLELFGGGRFEAFSTDVKDRSRKSRFSTFEWRSEFFIAIHKLLQRRDNHLPAG